MLVVGLTGSIGMGKSAAAQRFRERGFGVLDADAEVHRLYAGPLAASIGAAFPGTADHGFVDRVKLSAALLAAPQRFKDLEAIVHPRVREVQRAFLQREVSRKAPLAVLETPLLLEGGMAPLHDVIVVVSASADVQRARVLARPGMTADKLAEILRRQMPDAEKRAKADFVVDTNGSVDACNAQIDAIIDVLRARKGHAYVRHWS